MAVMVIMAMTMGLPRIASSASAVVGATEVTQWLNNGELVTGVAKQAQTVTQLAQTHIQVLEQVRQQVLAGKQLVGGDLLKSLGSINAEISAVTKYKAQLQNAGASVQQLASAMDARRVEANVKNLPLSDYLKQEAAKIADGDKRAKQRLEAEKHYAQLADDDLIAAKEMSEKITGTEGMHQAISLLNTSVNKMIQQNARMLQIMAYQAGSAESDRLAKTGDAKQSSSTMLSDIDAERKANLDRQNAMIDSIKKK
jgi:hypothetical protein